MYPAVPWLSEDLGARREIRQISYDPSIPKIDNLSIAYAGNEEKYTKLTVSDVESVIRDLDDDIAKAEARRAEYEKFCYGNPEAIEEMISTKEYIRDLQSTRDYISFIRDILADLDYSGFSDVLCNID